MKTYTLTESELQELLRKQRQNCLDAYQKENEYPDSDFAMAAILDAPSPLLPTEEVVTKEDDSQTGLKNVPEKIYLQIGDIDLSDGDDFKDLDEVSWCQNKIHENDIEYHLASVQPKDLASLASHSCTIGNSIQQVLNHIRKKAKTNERKWDRAQTTKDKVRFGTRARMCKELLNEIAMMPISTPNAPVSDTTEADSSNEDGNKKIPSIDWEGLESACEYWCHREFNESPPPVKVMEWLKTNLQDYIK